MSSRHEGSIGIALIGCGIVGGGCAKILLESRQEIRTRTGYDLVLQAVADRNLSHARSLGIPENLLHEHAEGLFSRQDIQVVIELVGGTGVARELVKKALESGKHVVTANKALLAHHGPELFALARKNKVCLAFEASCGGGIPIIRALYDGLSANHISALFGIVNGTCNFILTKMIQEGSSYSDALKEAQKLGFAEADPSLDVQGHDSSHKIAILAGLAFSAHVDLKDVSVKGIDTLQGFDVKAGVEQGYVIKLIAQAQRRDKGIFVRVEPAFISRNHPLAWVSGSFNAVSVYGHALGHSLYYGRGAGAMPTGSAVVADIISIANGSYPAIFNSSDIWSDLSKPLAKLGDEDIIRRYYLRLDVLDKPGTLARITGVLGSKGISVASIHQSEVPESNQNQTVPLIITVHACSEATIQAAVKEISALDSVSGPGVIIPILDEHPEFQ